MSDDRSAATSRIDTLRDNVRRRDRSIARRAVLLDLIRETQGLYQRRSDLGWFLSMVTLEAGTICAVLSGSRARSWGEFAARLEREILLLTIEQKLDQRELDLVGG